MRDAARSPESKSGPSNTAANRQEPSDDMARMISELVELRAENAQLRRYDDTLNSTLNDLERDSLALARVKDLLERWDADYPLVTWAGQIKAVDELRAAIEGEPT